MNVSAAVDAAVSPSRSAGPEAALGHWVDLERRGGATTPYRTLSWVSHWLAHFAPGAVPLVLDLPDHDALAAFRRRSVASVRLIEPVGTGISDYPGPVCLGEEPDAWAAILEALYERRSEWDLLRLDAILEPDGIAEAIRSAGEAPPAVRLYEECPRIDTREGFDVLLARRGRNQRKAVKRYRRRVDGLGQKEIVRGRPPLTPAEIAEFEEVERASWKWGKGDASFRNPTQSRFLKDLLSDPAAPLDVWRLRIDGRLAAFAVVLTGPATWYFYLSTYRDDCPHSGAFLLSEIIEAACSTEDCDFVDLLRGRFDYKEAWADETRTLYEVAIPSGVRGRALATAYRARWRAAESPTLREWRTKLLGVGDRRSA